MEQTLSHIHRFKPATLPGSPPLLLLHGTGGDENDLLPLGAELAPGSALLSPRGKVEENGMPRFFRRLSEGVFDEDDVMRRADELAAFIAEARAAYQLHAPVAVGFSNGANIAAALLYRHPEALAGAVLMRAMLPLRQGPVVKLPGTPVLILSGAADPIVPAANVGLLAETLRQAGAEVMHETQLTGHNLVRQDIDIAKTWLGRNFPKS